MAGLYIHVPFHRDPHVYDEQYAVPVDEADVSQFETALQRELLSYAQSYAEEEPITTAYVGGSRPSLLPVSTAHSLLRTVVDVFDASAFEEATAEVNPADATAGYLHRLRRLGFDRLSLDVLSFFPDDLQTLEAPHSAEDAVRALQQAREAGFETLSVDLLFGWTGQPLSHWKAVLRCAVEMNVPHLTIVEATAEEGPVVSDEARADRLEFAMTFLQSEGYDQYELTHFARPGHRSAHQEHYYAHGNYLGLGPTAESFWWVHREDGFAARRWSNVRDLDQYASLLDGRYPPVAFRRTLNRAELAHEYVLLRLRTSEGLDLDVLDRRYGVDLSSSRPDLLDRLQEENLIRVNEQILCLTNRGRLVADAIAKRLLSSS